MKARKFLKSIAFSMAICMSISLLGGISGATTKDKSEVDNRKVQLISDTVFSENEEGIENRNILCLIAGHSTTNITQKMITHRFQTNPLRCREQTYRVVQCTRSGCNYSVRTLIEDKLIICC